MENFVVVAVLVLAAALGISSAVKHFKGQGGCCGGGGYKPKKKKLPNVMYRKTFRIDGMHCEHCKNRVEEVINDIKGVAGKVDLKHGVLTVSYAEDVDDEIIKAKITRAGYTVIE